MMSPTDRMKDVRKFHPAYRGPEPWTSAFLGVVNVFMTGFLLGEKQGWVAVLYGALTVGWCILGVRSIVRWWRLDIEKAQQFARREMLDDFVQASTEVLGASGEREES